MTDTPNTPARPARRPSIGDRQSAIGDGRRGFTLIELMVVIAIILVLLGILVAGMGKFSAFSSVAAAKAMLATLQTGLTAYESDHKDFPPSNSAGSVGGISVSGWHGGEILAQALNGPRNDDGVAGHGFDDNGNAAGGRKYGPYVTTKHESNLTQATAAGRYKYTLADSAGKKAVLYYAAQVSGATGTNIGAASSVWFTGGRFDPAHNSTLANPDNPTTYWLAATLGTSGFPTTQERDSYAMSLRGSKYLLVYPGPDDKYGTRDDVTLNGK